MQIPRVIRLLITLLVIPCIAFGVAQGLLLYVNHEWYNEFAQAFAEIRNPTPTQQKINNAIESLSVQQLCAKPAFRALGQEFEKACSEDEDPLSMMSRGAEVAAIVGVGLIIVIAMCGLMVKSSRAMLVVLFLPGLYLTLITLVALIALHATLLIASLYFVFAQFQRIPVGIMFAVGVGALLGIGTMIRSAYSAIRRAETAVLGKCRKLAEADPLRAFLENLTKHIGTTMPDNVVVGFTPNFFVTEAKVRCLDGALTGRTLYLCLPLARILTESELGAVLGHELGHFKGSDTKYSRWFYPIYRGTGQALTGLLDVAQGKGSQGFAVLPAAYALSFFWERFATAESRLSREREIAADAVGAQITSARTCASALIKIHAFAPLWSNVYDEMREMLQDKKQFINASSYWAGRIGLVAQMPNLLAEMDTTTTETDHPTDSHPPLGVRLNALHVAAESVASDSVQCMPSHPAIELIPEHEEIEKTLTDIETSIISSSVQRDIGAESGDA